jgi:hypothetical protein
MEEQNFLLMMLKALSTHRLDNQNSGSQSKPGICAVQAMFALCMRHHLDAADAELQQLMLLLTWQRGGAVAARLVEVRLNLQVHNPGAWHAATAFAWHLAWHAATAVTAYMM